jgi:hypothetical protein
MALTLTRIVFVDGGATPGLQDGSLTKPYRSIQSAVSAVPTPVTVDDSVLD